MSYRSIGPLQEHDLWLETRLAEARPRLRLTAEEAEYEHEKAMWLEEEGRKLRIVCAWCGTVTEEGAPGAQVSHGCCKPCSEKLRGGK